MTSITRERGWSIERIDQRAFEIDQVRQCLRIAPQHFYSLNFPASELDKFSMSNPELGKFPTFLAALNQMKSFCLILATSIVTIVSLFKRLVHVQNGFAIKASSAS
jgi:hypothetical protein